MARLPLICCPDVSGGAGTAKGIPASEPGAIVADATRTGLAPPAWITLFPIVRLGSMLTLAALGEANLRVVGFILPTLTDLPAWIVPVPFTLTVPLGPLLMAIVPDLLTLFVATI